MPIDEASSIWPDGATCAQCGDQLRSSHGFVQLAPTIEQAGFDVTMFDQLADIEEHHFWFGARRTLLCGLAKKVGFEPHRFLEIGCGTGSVLNAFKKAFPKASCVGSELNVEGLAHALVKLTVPAELVQMDARQIPARDVFDMIGAFDVIEHIAQDEAVLQSAFRALKPGGVMLVAVPQHMWLWSEVDRRAHHVRRYQRGEVERKMRSCGFQILTSTSYTALLFPLMAASRFVSRLSPKPAEFVVSPTVNKFMKAILNFEVYLTLLGIRWPVGGSRVVVAQRPA